MDLALIIFIGFGVFGFLGLMTLVWLAMSYRRVVRTNEVHTVQSKKVTTAYGRSLPGGNVYYEWPEWIPKIGVSVISMPTSIFDIDLQKYEAYDEDRLPFQVDVKGFFQVDEAETAAHRVKDFTELKNQLSDILRGSIRTILGNANIQEILGERSKFSQEFTQEVSGQLGSWGVKSVKNIELMDVRDAPGETVIANIMEMKKSEIEMQSRKTVAENNKLAEIAETEATRAEQIATQVAEEEIGKRTAEKDKEIGIANEVAQQSINEQTKITAEKEQEVIRVNSVKSADIAKEVVIIEANEAKEKLIIIADAKVEQEKRDAETVIIQAEATLEHEKREAAAIEILAVANLVKQTNEATAILKKGEAEASAKKLIELAPVDALEKIAAIITDQPQYQEYLLGIKALEVGSEVGIAKAEALAEADLKIITNSGSISDGIDGIGNMVSSSGGTKIASMLEAVNQTEIGKEILGGFVNRLSPDSKDE